MADLTPGLVSFWPLNEANGDRADLHGGRTLADINTVGQGAGIGNGARFVNSVGSKLGMSLTTSPVFDLFGNYHLTCWAKRTGAFSLRLLTRQEGGTSEIRYSQIFDNNSLDLFHFDFPSPGQGVADHLVGTTQGTWYFVDIQYDAAAEVAKVSINLSGTTEGLHPPKGAVSTARPTIGARDPGSNPGDGDMQQLFLANGTILTDAELSAIYNGGNGIRYSGLEADLQNKLSEVILLSEPKGTRQGLKKSNTQFAQFGGNVSAFQGKVTLSGAADFNDANNERLEVDSDSSLQIGDNDFMLAVWALLDDKGSDMTLVSKWSAGEKEYRIRYDQTADRFAFEVSSDGSTSTEVEASTFGSPMAGCWHLIIAWHNASNNTINIQISNGTADSAAHAGGIHEGANDFVIGSLHGGGEYLDGRVGSVGLWTTILTSIQRSTFWNNGEGVLYGEIAVITLGEMDVAARHSVGSRISGKPVITSEVAGSMPTIMKVAGKQIAP